MRSIKLFLPVFLILLSLASCNKFSKIQKSKDYDYKLTKAEEYYAKDKYRYAKQLYEELFPVYKGNQK